MQFNGFSVNDIGSFQQHFSMVEVLKEIDRQMAFANWLEDIQCAGGVSEETDRVILDIQKCFHSFCGIDDKMSENEIGRILQEEIDKNIMEKFLLWEEKVGDDFRNKYHVFCVMIILLAKLGEYVITSEDEERIFKYILDSGMVRKKLLRLLCKEDGKGEIFYGDNLIESFVITKKDDYEKQQFAFISENQDTGYIGIKKDGSLVNRSAFSIGEVDKKAVKVCHNLQRYVILLEDGSLIHNLKYSILPEAPVKNIALYGEQLNFVLMD